MSDWVNIKLNDIGKIVTGKTPETIDPFNYGSDYMFLGPTDLHKHFIISKSEKMISEKGLLSIKGSIIDGLSILVGCIGWDMGNVALVKGKCATNQQINSITQIKDSYNPFYIYYWFKQKKQYLFQIASVTRTPMLKKTDFSNIELNLPSKYQQDKVSNILISLDSKIEINNRINAELETMAKTLYDYWFVQFDFPDKNGKPYKTNGGKMVWNEELKREIPEGWEALKLSSKFSFEKGIEPGSAEYVVQKKSNYHVNFIRVGDVDGSSEIFIDTRQKSYAMVSERDVLVTFDGSVGKVAFGLEGAYSGGLRKIYDNSGVIDNSLIYYIFKDERIIRTIHKYATGSILLHAGSSINILKIPYNEKKYLEYQDIIKSSYNKMVINKKENQQLTELRDWLLPMLMNGQVKVNEAKEYTLQNEILSMVAEGE